MSNSMLNVVPLKKRGAASDLSLIQDGVDPSAYADGSVTPPAGQRVAVVTSFKAYNRASGKYYDSFVLAFNAELPAFMVREAFEDFRLDLAGRNELFFHVEYPGDPCYPPFLSAPPFVRDAALLHFDD